MSHGSAPYQLLKVVIAETWGLSSLMKRAVSGTLWYYCSFRSSITNPSVFLVGRHCRQEVDKLTGEAGLNLGGFLKPRSSLKCTSSTTEEGRSSEEPGVESFVSGSKNAESPVPTESLRF